MHEGLNNHVQLLLYIYKKDNLNLSLANKIKQWTVIWYVVHFVRLNISKEIMILVWLVLWYINIL